MMTDRELLELAAKAAEIEYDIISDGDEGCVKFDDTDSWPQSDGGFWNPLSDDADAFRLAVQLQISIHMNFTEIAASEINLTLAGVFIKESTFTQNTGVATRRAIVRAAAEIGKRNRNDLSGLPVKRSD